MVALKQNGHAALIESIIGNVPVWGVLDTGADLVSVSEELAQAIVDSGAGHWTGETETFRNANGDMSYEKTFIIHNFTIGSQTVHDIKATAAPTKDAPYLIGMSALRYFGPFRIDVLDGTVTFN